jgi:hypoxanthine-DNA glycosylase
MTLQGLPPIIDENSRFLILGTFPSVISLEKQEYYANPANQFWKIMFRIWNTPFSQEYEKRLQLLAANRIALWDVLSQCERSGSSDNKIRNERPNDLKALIRQYPNITHLLFNGNKPLEFFVKHKLSEGRLVPVPPFPSTSPANTHLSLAEKIVRWSTINVAMNLL